MTTTLDTLELTPEQLDSCREEVRKLAYRKWQESGSPEGRELECWLAAEHEWIGCNYVPDRPCDGARPEDDAKCSRGPARRGSPARPKAAHGRSAGRRSARNDV